MFDSFAFNDTPQVLNLSSEWLCWCMLWAGIKVYSFLSRKKIPHVRVDDIEEESTSLAFFIITSSVCASIVEVNWILPFLTPALYFVSRNNYVDNHVLPSNSKYETSKYPENYSYHMIFYILVAISTSVLFLPSSSSPITIGLGFIFVICQTAIYWRLSLSQTGDAEVQSPCQIFLNLDRTCCWVVCFLTIILLASQQEPPEILSLSIYSILKALLWVAVIFLCKEGHACSLTLMSTFGLCILYILVIPSLALATLSCLCALLILSQIMSTLPRKCSTRLVIALFATFPVVTLLFRFGTPERIEAFLELMQRPFLQTSCATNQDIVRNAIDIAQAVMDEPSRLVAEFGPRKDLKSWLDAILVFSKSCTDSNPVTIEL
ncbi:44436499-6109-4d9a-b1c1-12dae27aa8c1 [Sclerotinia trifoliorum]|uniref:44436499-6109-4d9a-b1c1-12dae27aa8c1 n=1 Tax=Sclerotinia trifoliorum TaxID=28548 RepID=A0A8H2ZS36_9HELO|nr:44436499-6109-4d9a-b1c1-12dae27aa8c1 [Sclerotinia trifoliorum]